MNAEIQRLYSNLRSLENFLSGISPDAPDYEEYRRLVRRTEERISLVLLLHHYRDMLTRAHLSVLRQLKDANRDDFLLRRAYVLAYFGCACTALFERDDFRGMKQYFPDLKLPLLVEAQEVAQFNNSFYGGVNLEAAVSNELVYFRADPRAKPEENLRTMFWTPILKAMFNALKTNLGIDDLNMMVEFNTRNIPDFHELRFIDLVVAATGTEGLPILLVEMSAHPVPEGVLHKDFRKMAMTMIFLLMEMIKRAEVHCLNDDISKFQVFGILISGYSFELCVGTVAKDSSGRINFMFHSNSGHWKFSMNDSELNLAAGDFICAGTAIIVGPHSELFPTVTETDAETELFASPIQDLGEEEEEQEQSVPDFDLVSVQVQEPRLVLWKFVQAAMNYYSGLSQCLRECIKSKPAEMQEAASRYAMLPKELRPPVASSMPTHTGSSLQLSPVSSNAEHIVDSQTRAQFYKALCRLRLPTLPKVILWDECSSTATLSECRFGLCDYMKMIEAREDLPRVQLSCLAAKFILDMLMAAFELHRRGLVCGGFIEFFIRYDGMFWYLNQLSRLRTVMEAEEYGPVTFPDRIEAACHLHSPQIMSQADDLYGIIRTFMFYSNDRFRSIVYDSYKYPLFDQFKKETYFIMKYIQDNPDSNVETILMRAIPAYNNLVNGTELDDFIKKPVLATKIMANGLLSELSGRRGSISMHSIHSTTSESSEDK